jgi:hypothetical protein
LDIFFSLNFFSYLVVGLIPLKKHWRSDYGITKIDFLCDQPIDVLKFSVCSKYESYSDNKYVYIKWRDIIVPLSFVKGDFIQEEYAEYENGYWCANLKGYCYGSYLINQHSNSLIRSEGRMYISEIKNRADFQSVESNPIEGVTEFIRSCS